MMAAYTTIQEKYKPKPSHPSVYNGVQKRKRKERGRNKRKWNSMAKETVTPTFKQWCISPPPFFKYINEHFHGKLNLPELVEVSLPVVVSCQVQIDPTIKYIDNSTA